MKIVSNFKKILLYSSLPYWRIINAFRCWNLRKRLEEKLIALPAGADRHVGAPIPIVSSFRIDSVERQNILEKTFSLTFKHVAREYALTVIDASSGSQAEINRQLIGRTVSAAIDYRLGNDKLPLSYSKILTELRQDAVAIVFDDQPIVGLDSSLLKSAQSLLADLSGLVDLVLFEYPKNVIVNKENNSVSVDLESLEFISAGVEPLRIVKYGEHRFAIIKNYHYGFFFNNVIVNRVAYLERLNWFRKRTGNESTVEIEKLGSKRAGPAYHFIAIPLDAFMMDLDFCHSVNSTRGENRQAEELFEALNNNTRIIINPNE